MPTSDSVNQDRCILTRLFEAAVDAADPEHVIAAHLPPPPEGRTVVVGAGKGAAQMARAIETHMAGSLTGVVVTRYGHGAVCKQIRVLEAGHPVPDDNGILASAALIDAVSDLTADDLVLALICGGGSALLACPAPPLTLAHEQELNRILIASGVPIAAMNAIRIRASAIKGGRLAARAYPARVVSLVVSDICGDIAAQVASGPTIPGGGEHDDIAALIAAYDLDLPGEILDHVRLPESAAPDPSDPVFANNRVQVIASAGLSLEAAAAAARVEGIPAVILSDAMQGEARDVGSVHAAIARYVRQEGQPFAPPVAILSGGETTVTLRGSGRGGPNGEFLLSLAQGIDGLEGITAMAADTDGIDGSEGNAGAFADGATVQRLRTAGRDPRTDLANNDSHGAFSSIGDVFAPGPTGTNVNDFRAVLIR